MKKIFARIGRLILAVALPASLLSATPLAAAEVPVWSVEPIPNLMDHVLGPPGIDVRDLTAADDGATLYAVPGDSIAASVMYKSSDSGLSWIALDIPVRAELVTVAPDNADVVVVARKNVPVVYVTTNGGSTWHFLGRVGAEGGTTTSVIHDIALSPASEGTHIIAVAGETEGDRGNIWYTTANIPVSAWMETSILPGFENADTVKSIAFSPGFTTDSALTAVSVSDNGSISFQLLSFAEQKWNHNAGLDNYPVAITSDDEISRLASVSISLSPQYKSSERTKRAAFIGLTVDGDTDARATSGIYRLTNDESTALKTGINIHSIIYNGINLIAGSHDGTIVYRSTNPMAVTPSITITPLLKSPGGENRVVVTRSGSHVVAGTSGDESALAISRDDGRTFNDISLIDTELANLTDVAVATDGKKIYLATDDGTDLSLWRKDLSWERVLSKQNTTSYIIRTAPSDADVIYLAQKNATTVYYSKDGGEAEWQVRTSNVNIQDLAIESADIAYALSHEGKVAKTTTAGLTWEAEKPTKLDENTGHMIVSVSQDNLLVGSTNGYVAYSTDGSVSWNKIPKILHGAAREIQVIADHNFATNKVIYAASSKGSQKIKRWTIGTSGDWTEIFGNTVPGGIYGMAVDAGILYALEFNPRNNQSTLWRLLSPIEAGPSTKWKSYSTTAGIDATDNEIFLNASPQALKISSDGKRWSIKTNGTNRLYSLTDIMSELILIAPEPDFVNPINTVTGIVNEISFRWERWAAATKYELSIAPDREFTLSMTKITVESDLTTVVVRVGPARAGDEKVTFNPGTTYYWRVRVTQPQQSLYSETRSFKIGTLEAAPPVIIKRPPPQVIELPVWPDIIIQWPDIVVPPVPEVSPPTKIVVSPPSAPSAASASVTPAYIWGIIGFGAILVIAAIIVIWRTSWPGGSRPVQVERGEDTGEIVAWAKGYLGITKSNNEMSDEDIHRVIQLLGEQAPDTAWVDDKPLLGRIGSGSISLIIKTEFPEFYHSKYETQTADTSISDTEDIQ
jgi:photosystem II stability/assembly factor-like uncharacterized protein